MKYVTVATVVFGLYMKCTILVLYWPNIGTILYFVTVWFVYYWFVIGWRWPRVRLALRENDEKHGKKPAQLLLILLFFAQDDEHTVI